MVTTDDQPGTSTEGPRQHQVRSEINLSSDIFHPLQLPWSLAVAFCFQFPVEVTQFGLKVSFIGCWCSGISSLCTCRQEKGSFLSNEIHTSQYQYNSGPSRVVPGYMKSPSCNCVVVFGMHTKGHPCTTTAHFPNGRRNQLIEGGHG